MVDIFQDECVNCLIRGAKLYGKTASILPNNGKYGLFPDESTGEYDQSAITDSWNAFECAMDTLKSHLVENGFAVKIDYRDDNIRRKDSKKYPVAVLRVFNLSNESEVNRLVQVITDYNKPTSTDGVGAASATLSPTAAPFVPGAAAAAPVNTSQMSFASAAAPVPARVPARVPAAAAATQIQTGGAAAAASAAATNAPPKETELQRKDRLQRELEALERKQKELAIAFSEAEKAVEEQNPTVKKEMGDNFRLMLSTAARRGIEFDEVLAEVLTEEQLRQLLQKIQAPAAAAAEPVAAAIPEPAAAAAAADAAADTPEPAAAAAAAAAATSEPVAAETPDIHLQRAKKKKAAKEAAKKADKEQ
jgi:hypothetical protein